MPFVIGEPCLDNKDGSCLDVCPVDCIYDIGDMMVISADECIDCSSCQSACPVEAIESDVMLDEMWEPFVVINTAWDTSPDLARERLAEYRAARDA